MSNDKQTFNHNPNQSSVDWVIGEILKHEMTFFGTASIPLYIIEQAKAMHKDEHGKTWDNSMDNLELRGGNHIRAWVDFDEYYNETYGGNK